MTLKDLDNKLETGFEKIKYFFRVFIEYVLVLIICLSVVVFSRFFEYIPSNTIAVILAVLITIYLAGLMGYKYIFKKRILKGAVSFDVGKTSFYSLYAVFLLASALLSFGIEWLITMPKTPELLFAILTKVGFGIILNFIVENEYRYWGMIFYNRKIFLIFTVIVYIFNLVLAHYLFYGTLLLFFLVWVFPKVLKYTVKPFIPDGFVVSSNGDIGFFYKF